MNMDRTEGETGRRLRALVLKVASDSVEAVRPGTPNSNRARSDGLDAAIDWLTRTHDVTGRQGSSRGYSLLKGWAAAFPETSGYLIGTLIAYGLPRGRDDLLVRARELADWEIEVQEDDGGIMQGLFTRGPRHSIAFNTGMVMHGWLDLWKAEGGDKYLEAAARGGEFLVNNQAADGSWTGNVSYRQIPHTYKSRVSWALLRLADAAGDDRFRQTARANLDWVLTMQRPNGWFDQCCFEPGTLPNTHGIAYTLRGLVESYALLSDERYLAAAQLTSRALIEQLHARDTLPATWSEDWTTKARYRCLTGIVQLGGVWLRIHELTGDAGYREAGQKAVEHAASFQLNGREPELRGALPGSFPIYGRYAPLACPNWATKFLADGLMLRERAGTAGTDAPVWG
jgi:hypothetical protein